MKKCVPFGSLPLSSVVVHDHKFTAELSGQIGVVDGQLVDGIEQQTRATLNNLIAVLDSIGWSIDDIVKMRVFLSDMSDYGKMNDVYNEFFSQGFPSRVALAVKGLPRGALVEIECVAASDVSPQ